MKSFKQNNVKNIYKIRIRFKIKEETIKLGQNTDVYFRADIVRIFQSTPAFMCPEFGNCKQGAEFKQCLRKIL